MSHERNALEIAQVFQQGNLKVYHLAVWYVGKRGNPR